MKKSIFFSALSFFIILTWLTSTGYAEPITYGYQGTVTSMWEIDLPTGLYVDDTFEVYLTFDTELDEDNNPIPEYGVYYAMVGASVYFPRIDYGLTITPDQLLHMSRISIENDRETGWRIIDSLNFIAYESSPPPTVEDPSGFIADLYLHMLDYDHSVFSSTELSQLGPSPVDLALFEFNHFNFHFFDFGVGEYNIAGTLTGVIDNNPVPEPATMLLLGTGLAGLAGFRRKFKKA